MTVLHARAPGPTLCSAIVPQVRAPGRAVRWALTDSADARASRRARELAGSAEGVR